MKQRFWLYRRGAIYYLQDSESGERCSLNTSDRREAEQLRNAKNESVRQPQLSLAIAKAYLAAADRRLVERTWNDVIVEFCSKGKQSTRDRRDRELRQAHFNRLRPRKLFETTGEDLNQVLAGGGVMTNHCLRCLQNLALGLGWLPFPVIPPKLWPTTKPKPKRSITWEEHQTIVASEQNVERRLYYEILWETGAAQTDAAMLTAEQVDWKNRTLSFQRCKTGEWAHLRIGPRLESSLRQLPVHGNLFPRIAATSDSARSSEFSRRCRLVGVKGVTLHSYRYAWAERARLGGYPERWAQSALGHNSRAVHHAYARQAHVICPPLDEYTALHNFTAAA